MPKGKKNEPKLESGLGELSAEDLAAIQGSIPDEPMLTSGAPIGEEAVIEEDEASPEEIALGARVATLEHELGKLRAAFESWATHMQANPSASQRFAPPVAVRRASAAEEAAYCRANFNARERGETPFDGIQAWRDAGSPGLAA